MKQGIQFSREIPIRYRVDVFVAGGGPAGVAAAVAAARQGRQVLLVDGQICLGGMGTAGLVPAFMRFTDGVNFLAAGIGQEILEKLQAAGGSGPDDPYAIRTEVLKRVYDDLLAEVGVSFILQTQVIAVEGNGGCLSHAILSGKSGLFGVEAQMFIDCTGDGDLAAWSGAPFEKGDAQGAMMPGTLGSLWAGIAWDRVVKPDDRRLPEAFEDQVFTYEDRHLPGMWRVGYTLGGGNIGHTFGVDSTDERSLTEAAVDGRRRMAEYERYYKEYLTGYEQMELVTTASLVGIRESRRIMGDYLLCLDDFKQQAVFPDEIGRYAYPVDIHASRPAKDDFQRFEEEFRSLRYQSGESYGIPYRVLTPQGLSNVLVAGRCLSADRYLQGSVRVMPGCYITGQAAGVAASIAIELDTDIRGFSVTDLQQRLVQMGAYLPNFRSSTG